MKIIFLGDIFGKPGRQLVLENIVRLKQQYSADVFIINGENIADGRGLTEKTTKPLFDAGVSAITSGNHLWDRYESLDYLRNEHRIVKPLNFPSGALGNSFLQLHLDTATLTLVCLTGQMFMPPCDSPFNKMEEYLKSVDDFSNVIFVDFHAESTAEKRAFAQMFDGKVSFIAGTHTHIQTADEEIMPLGTGYITDVGMTGPHDSVIGVKKHLIVEKMKTGMPVRYEVATSGLQINGLFCEIDETSGKTISVSRIRELIGD